MPKTPRRRWGSFPTTADIGVSASADTPAGLFEALGLGLFALTVDLRGVRVTEERRVRARGSDIPSLTVAWLTELLLLDQTEGFLVRDIHATLLGTPPTAIDASVRGERADPARHPRRLEVKAVTFHALEMDLERGRARVIVDI